MRKTYLIRQLDDKDKTTYIRLVLHLNPDNLEKYICPDCKITSYYRPIYTLFGNISEPDEPFRLTYNGFSYPRPEEWLEQFNKIDELVGDYGYDITVYINIKFIEPYLLLDEKLYSSYFIYNSIFPRYMFISNVYDDSKEKTDYFISLDLEENLRNFYIPEQYPGNYLKISKFFINLVTENEKVGYKISKFIELEEDEKEIYYRSEWK
jgi:hypothetical protein